MSRRIRSVRRSRSLFVAVCTGAAACGGGDAADGPAVFDDIATAAASLGTASGPVQVTVAAIPASALPDSSLAMWLGRFLEPTDYGGDRPVLVITNELWQTMGADPAAIGSELELDGTSRILIGVAPPGWGNPPGTDAWIQAGALRLTPR